MEELVNPSSEPAGVYIHDLSVRYNEQIIPLEALDSTEVLAEAKLQLAGSISGKVEGGVHMEYEQTYRPFSVTRTFTGSEQTNLGRFRTELKLHNGANLFVIKAVTQDGKVLDRKEFCLSYKGSFREWNETIFIAFFLAILIRGLVVQAFWIPTGSMEPTLLGEFKNAEGKVTRNGDRILVNRFAYVLDFSLDGRLTNFATQGLSLLGIQLKDVNSQFWLKLPERGDIVVFKFPDKDVTNPPKDYIKRVIGLPGDSIRIVNGITYVNGVALEEPYISEPPVRNFPEVGDSIIVAPDHLFVMGDNRNNSFDSRYWGLMPLKNLKGQAIFSYLPLNRLGPIRSFIHKNLDPIDASKPSL